MSTENASLKAMRLRSLEAESAGFRAGFSEQQHDHCTAFVMFKLTPSLVFSPLE